MIDLIQQRIRQLPSFQLLVASKKGEITVTGLAGSALAFVVAGLRDELRAPVIVAARDENSSETLRDDLVLILGGERVHLFRGGHRGATGSSGQSVPDVQALRSFAEAHDSVLVVPPHGMASRLPLPSVLREQVFRLCRGEAADLVAVVRTLNAMGFEKKEFVESHGDYAVRGGILDVFSHAGENPVRVEFAGDSIESLREFDPLSQRSIREIEQATVLPDLLRSRDGEGQSVRASLVTDYASEGTLIIVEEPDLIRRDLEGQQEGSGGARASFAEVWSAITRFRSVTVRSLAGGESGVIDFGSLPQPAFNGSIATLRQDIARLQEEKVDVAITCDSQAELSRLKELVEALPEEAEETAGKAASAISPVKFALEALHGGFILPEGRLAVYTEHQIFNRVKRRGRARPGRVRGFTAREMQKLVRGDFVVHQDFGIGRYDGMKKIRVGDAEQEVVKIRYQEGDTLFVNLNYLGKLQKYASQEGHVPVLSRLSSGEWDRLRARAKKKVKDIARDLITLYARRKSAQGFAYAPDSPWQKELEASFMYEDTFDQAKATLDVKKDMESPHPMDRLICGDVGFGKTEVAVRAAFKAVLDGKQVAVLVPTTILAMQHYHTFRDRIGRYAVRLEVMSRFRSKKEQDAIAARLKSGELDIVIGTHRILSKDIAMKNLGLLIVDEEHRFGVGAKEKLRQMRTEVDTLSLTATPIPRTLHFSLLGARDLSIIATPPRNRLPVITEILQWNDEVIRQAVVRELQRGGQVYFVHDRVQTMNDVVGRLQTILPAVRIRAAHGQMSSHALENVMMAFLEKRCDMLVATKIIESGLDIPNVNTIVINRADRFGMAELYQLRGRVGRSNVQAYAYLLVPPVASMPKQTVQRLQAMEEFTELGSGFHLAMRDLEIRGAGNLLGAEQSGFIETMGFETYTRILEEAVQELKDEEFRGLFTGEGLHARRRTETVVESDLDAFIPDQYVGSDAERLLLYRRLYDLTTLEQLQEVREEMTDRFGKFPVELDHLFGMVRLRLAGAAVGFSRIALRGERMHVEFPPETSTQFYESERFQQLIKNVSGMKSRDASLRQEGNALNLSLRLDGASTGIEKLEKAITLLCEISSKRG
ncbi:MAG: transcription-repair coupling factor [Bacteroidota bacterium]